MDDRAVATVTCTDALPNVACVGGSWIVPTDAIAAGDWHRIEALAREASQLAR